MREKATKIKKILGTAILIAIIASALVAVFASAFKKDDKKPVFLFGKTLLWVETPSMEPTIEARSFISAKKYDGKGVEEGDVITFVCNDKTSAVYGRLITHRVVEITENGYKTKGDSPLSAVDSWTVKDDEIVAVYLKNLKAFTFVGRVFASPAGLIIIIATFIFSCAFVYIPEAVNALKTDDGKTEKEKEIDRRVKEEVEKMLKENGGDKQ